MQATKPDRSSFFSKSGAFLRATAWAALCVCLVGCYGVSSGGKSKTGISVAAFEPETPNPLFVKTADHELLWDAVVDVVDNYFVVENETPIRSFEKTDKDGRVYVYMTEGRIDTKPAIVGGVLEPWRKTAATCEQRWRAEFQTTRSTAVVRIVPEETGFFVYLSIYDELEDLSKPIGSTVDYNINYNDDLTQIEQPVGEYQRSKGWITTGRNTELETAILKEIAWRVGVPRTVLHEGAGSDLTP